MRGRILAVLGMWALWGAGVAYTQDTPLDQRVRSFLESHRGSWRDLNVP
jgi:hypothetical protein